jgi:hypothetical protein
MVIDINYLSVLDFRMDTQWRHSIYTIVLDGGVNVFIKLLHYLRHMCMTA